MYIMIHISVFSVNCNTKLDKFSNFSTECKKCFLTYCSYDIKLMKGKNTHEMATLRLPTIFLSDFTTFNNLNMR